MTTETLPTPLSRLMQADDFISKTSKSVDGLSDHDKRLLKQYLADLAKECLDQREAIIVPVAS